MGCTPYTWKTTAAHSRCLLLGRPAGSWVPGEPGSPAGQPRLEWQPRAGIRRAAQDWPSKQWLADRVSLQAAPDRPGRLLLEEPCVGAADSAMCNPRVWSLWCCLPALP